MATKKTTARRTSKPDSGEAPAVSEATSPVKEQKVKSVEKPETAPRVETPPQPPPPHWVELAEGATYMLRGMTFHKNRPVVVSDPKVLAVVLHNSRFKCRSAGGG